MALSNQLKAFLIFAVVMFVGMWVGQIVAAYIPAMGNPLVAGAVAFIVTIAPGYVLYIKVAKKVE